MFRTNKKKREIREIDALGFKTWTKSIQPKSSHRNWNGCQLHNIMERANKPTAAKLQIRWSNASWATAGRIHQTLLTTRKWWDVDFSHLLEKEGLSKPYKRVRTKWIILGQRANQIDWTSIVWSFTFMRRWTWDFTLWSQHAAKQERIDNYLNQN